MINIYASNMADEYGVIMITVYNENTLEYTNYDELPILWQAKAFVYNGTIVYQGNFVPGDFAEQTVPEGVLFTATGLNKTISIPSYIDLDNVIIEVATDCGTISSGVPDKYAIDFGAPAAKQINKQIQESSKVTMSVYPNPVTESVSVDFQSKENGTYEMAIVSYDGRKIKNLGKGVLNANQTLSKTYNLSDIPAGVYLLQLTNNKKEKFSKKIIRQ